jgi:hypothetical protein
MEAPVCPDCKTSMIYTTDNEFVCFKCFRKDGAQDSDGELVNKYKRDGPPAIVGFSMEEAGRKEHERSLMSTEERKHAEVEEKIRQRLKGLNVTDIKFED